MLKKRLYLVCLVLLLTGCGGGGGSSSGFQLASGGGTPSPPPVGPTGSPTPTPVPTPPVEPGIPPVLSPDDVVFFRNDAPGGGDGTASAPYNDLSTAVSATQPGETLFLYAGTGPTSFNGTFPGNIRVLGEGLGFTSSEFNVPAGTFPRLQGRITLAGGAVVQGVQFENPGGDALVTSGVQEVTLDSNRFTNIGGSALLLSAPDGNAFVLNNDFQDDGATDPANAVAVSLPSSQALNLTLDGNTFTTPNRATAFDNGLEANCLDSSQLTLTVRDNSFAVQSRGVFLRARNSSSVTATLTQNTFTQTLLDGVGVVSGTSTSDNTTSDIEVTNNNFSQTLGPGVSLRAQGAGTNDWTVQQNSVQAGGNFGLLFVRADTALVRAEVDQNTITGAAQAGIQYTSGTPSGGFTVPLTGEDRFTMDGNQITGSGVSGIDLNLVSQTHAALLLNNTTQARINVLARAADACFGAGSNTAGGSFSVTVESGFALTYDDRGQTTPAVTFSGGGTVTPGACNP